MPTQRSNLDFRWAIAVDGAVHEADVNVRTDNAAERGVPFPEGWRVALSARDLGSRAAQQAVQRARAEFSLTDDVKLDCRTPAEFAMNNVAIMRLLMFLW